MEKPCKIINIFLVLGPKIRYVTSSLSGQKRTKGFAGAVSSAKHKIYCKRCLDSDVASLLAEDGTAIILGQHALAQTQDQIESHLYVLNSFVLHYCIVKWNIIVWDLKAESNQLRNGWISSATSMAINYL